MRCVTLNELSAGHGTDKRLSLSNTGSVSFFGLLKLVSPTTLPSTTKLQTPSSHLQTYKRNELLSLQFLLRMALV